jgi:tetratricopeptide (TPR) repeat protein
MQSEVETLPPDVLEQLTTLRKSGLLLHAYAQLAPLPALHSWRGQESRLLAGRLAWQLGARRQGHAILLHAWRRHPASVDAFANAVGTTHELHGAYAAWRLLERAPPASSPTQEADLLAARVQILAQLRDFDAARHALAQATALDPANSWVVLAAAWLHEHADEYDAALVVARRAYELAPHWSSAVTMLAHLLHLVGRDAEGIDVLLDALARLEVGHVALHAVHALQAAARYDEAHAMLRRVEELHPLAEPALRSHFAGMRFEVAYQLGRDDEARASAAQASTFHRRQAERLAASADRDEPVLHCPVPFVRQHYNTCGPATLTALALSFGVPTDHLAVAHAICYGGTYDYAERRWALDNGFHAREFCLTVAAARALLARGIPFAVATQHGGGGHLQALIGHDPRRGVFVVRDPFVHKTSEWLADEFIASNRSSGPRALAIVPQARAAELDAIDLPAAALYDAVFAVNEALRVHDHDQAVRRHHELAAQHEDHPLVLNSRWTLSATKPQVWMRVARHGSDLEVKLAALTKARRLAPTWSTPYDAAADVLAQAGRYDDADAVLASFPAPTLPPHLRGRQAFVMAQRGNLQVAVALMLTILAQTPNYVWGRLGVFVSVIGSSARSSGPNCWRRPCRSWSTILTTPLPMAMWRMPWRTPVAAAKPKPHCKRRCGSIRVTSGPSPKRSSCTWRTASWRWRKP